MWEPVDETPKNEKMDTSGFGYSVRELEAPRERLRPVILWLADGPGCKWVGM